ncbi:MAG: hypothetical protein SCJ94_07220 [Bacillota bacterium]|nr:hypothetical protein [Bacillota bacterium]
MLYMATSSFPLKSTIDAGKVFLEATSKQMTYVNRVGMWLCYGGDGVKTWFVYEVTKGHEEEGLKELTNYYTAYFSIEGYKVDITPVLKPEDALPLIGLSSPG